MGRLAWCSLDLRRPHDRSSDCRVELNELRNIVTVLQSEEADQVIALRERLDALAAAVNQHGVDIISFEPGDPNATGPLRILHAATAGGRHSVPRGQGSLIDLSPLFIHVQNFAILGATDALAMKAKLDKHYAALGNPSPPIEMQWNASWFPLAVETGDWIAIDPGTMRVFEGGPGFEAVECGTLIEVLDREIEAFNRYRHIAPAERPPWFRRFAWRGTLVSTGIVFTLGVLWYAISRAGH